MGKMIFNFNATRVDNIEKANNDVIANLVSSTQIKVLAKIIENASVEGDKVGCSNSMAIKRIDDYLDGGGDIDGLTLDITEALVDKGFLSRELQVQKMRDLKDQQIKKVMKDIDKTLAE